MSDFLDRGLNKRLRDSVNSSPIFSYGTHKEKYNLICAVLDRIDTCVDYLNNHDKYPSSEEDFIIFVMFASMLLDSKHQLLEKIGLVLTSKTDDSNFFGNYYQNSKIYNPEAHMPDDDAIFRHIRSLTFAHPVDSSKAKFLKKNEIQYSPWVLANKTTNKLYGITDGVGLRIYTNKSDDIIDFIFSFSNLKQYVKSRYENLELAIEWCKHEISETAILWGKRKVKRAGSPQEALKDIIEILKERYCDELVWDLGTLYHILQYKTTDRKNQKALKTYHESIEEKIPMICDLVDALRHDEIYHITSELLYSTPKVKDQGALSYKLEKIMTSGGYIYMKMAESFANGFAKKYLNINAAQMSTDEVRLLVRTACFLEKQSQERENA